jgi:hypothetical protein
MLINYILFLMTFLLFGGITLDAGLLELRRLRIQQAADAAAQEAMYQFARNSSSWSSAGKAQAAMNGFTDGSNGVTVSIANPPTTGTYAGNTLVFQATVAQNVNTLLMGLLNHGTSTIAATAFAEELPTCFWIMNNSGTSPNGSLRMQSATLNANCGVYINTSGNNSQKNLNLDFWARLTVSGSRIRVVGPYSDNISSTQCCFGGMIGINPQPRYAATVKSDPLAYVTAPSLSSCTYNNTSFWGGTHTLSPGTYCGGIDIANNATVTFSPGLYIIAGGLSSSDSYIYGTGVTLYFTKTSGASSYSPITVTGPCCSVSTYGLYLKAPTSSANGGIPGVVMFADRNWVDHGNQDFQFNYATLQTDGYWYLPNTGLYMWATNLTYYKYNGLVIDNYYQFGTTNYLNSDFSDLGGVSPLHYEDGVLVQ